MTLFIFVCAFLLIGLNTPIFISLACTTFVVFALFTNMPLGILPQRMFAGVDNMALIAIPYFIFAAQIMSKGGLTVRLIKFAQTLVGHLPGGLGICAVLSCLFFAAISGSTASTVVAVGSIIYPALLKAGYGEKFSLGLVTCSALLGMVIPPSNAMIIYGSISRVSIGALFLSGFGAGMVFVCVYSAWCVYHAYKTKVPLQQRATLREITLAAKDAGWSLGFPLVILGGIYSGVFTSTESAVVSVAYAILVAMVIYRELKPQEIWVIACETGLASAKILIMVAAATLFSWLLTVENITTQLIEPIKALDLPWWSILFINNVIMLFAGMFIDVFSNILIFCPLMTPLIQEAGISTLHFGLIASVNADMGNITPPFGLNLFIASGVFGVSYFTIVRAVLPWLCLALLCLMIITYVPQISLWLPSIIYPGSF
ncbi:TRAP transporter large permease [Desulfotalea psychrophila]|uniref:Probable DctM (C4-dicarboxylate permease, large subunit) n=1 Tax=Desulfotalea psychrophila (strain LSv54 / DSM 12343) TaxID=177439 RepID=Q6AP08_DESPS|nr:TRAP transporter large permease [Desulfotalea psychrophila]CAG35916.1 probable DctM (C4-dicarboxylate permease, large subunit) [Desulfotalea psychrophila LSv54]